MFVGRGGEYAHVTIWPFLGWTNGASLDAMAVGQENKGGGCYASSTEPAGPLPDLLASMEVARLLIGAAAMTRVLVKVGHEAVLPSRWTVVLKDVSLKSYCNLG